MTIYDVAKSCGVSIATVSRVLNGSAKVRPDTREKILAAMKDQGYSPNPFARGPRLRFHEDRRYSVYGYCR